MATDAKCISYFCQLTDRENIHTKNIAEFVYLSCTYIKYFFIGFWWSILPQYFNGYWYFHIFPIRSPHPLKKGVRIVLYWQCPFKGDYASMKEQTPLPCKQYRTPQHPTLSTSSTLSLSRCASEPDWATRRWGPEVPPAVWMRTWCFSEAPTGCQHQKQQNLVFAHLMFLQDPPHCFLPLKLLLSPQVKEK